MRDWKEIAVNVLYYGKLIAHNDGKEGCVCKVRCPASGNLLMVIASWEEGWDHVSVSMENRTPSWVEMCFIKKMFFKPDEVAIEYHPAEKKYVDNHKHCLHIWRPQGVDLPEPPIGMIGVK